jgi:tRNA-dihydrouridine synthase 4
MEQRIHPLQIQSDTGYLRICAPMVRYSKLAFRQLVREYGVDLAYTPMILSDVFRNSKESRNAEFITCKDDSPLIVQFAAQNSKDAADSAEMVARYCNGVDINCGCPQKWAIQEGIGSFLLSQPETVKDIVDQIKRRTCNIKMTDGTSFPCSIKIRIDDDLKKTIELCKRAEQVGVDWITVHGRTKKQKNADTVNLEAIKMVKESLSIPVFANGGIETIRDAEDCIATTKTNGVMVAQGLLENPALFDGYEHTPVDAIKSYVTKAITLGTNHFIFHHHIMFMCDKIMSKQEKKNFNCLYSIPAILDYLEEHYGINFDLDSLQLQTELIK